MRESGTRSSGLGLGLFVVREIARAHGGQFVVRGLTEAIFKRAGQPYIRGHYAVRGNQVYVNRGLGFGFGGPYLRRGAGRRVKKATSGSAPRRR